MGLMSLPRFDFVGLPSDEYSQNSEQITFGRGYVFASAPRGPNQITTRISFPKGLWWFEDPITRVMNLTVHPTLNIAALKTFYEDVQMWKVFEYDHPHRGVLRYRFSKPLVIPKIVDEPDNIGGYGGYRVHRTDPLDMSMVLQG